MDFKKWVPTEDDIKYAISVMAEEAQCLEEDCLEFEQAAELRVLIEKIKLSKNPKDLIQDYVSDYVDLVPADNYQKYYGEEFVNFMIKCLGMDGC